jgi:hypothetical protein
MPGFGKPNLPFAVRVPADPVGDGLPLNIDPVWLVVNRNRR